MLPSPFCPVFHLCCMPLSCCLFMCVLLHDTTDASFSILSCVPRLLYASVLMFMYVCSVARYYRCFLLHSVLCSTFVVCLCLAVYVCVFCCTILQMLPSPFCPEFHVCCMPLSYCLCMCVLLHDTTDASFSILSCVPRLLYASVLLFMYVCSVARYYRCFLLHSVLCSTFVVCICLTVYVCVFCCTILQMLPSPFCPVFHVCCMPLSYCLCMCVLLHDTTDASFSILSCVPPLLYASVLLFMYVCSVARYYRCFLLHSVLCSTFVVCLCLAVYVCVFCCTILQMLPSPFCPVFHVCCMPLSCCLCMCVLLHDTTDASFSILSCVPRLLYASVLLFMYVCSVARYYRCFLLHSVLCSTFVVCLCLAVYVCVFCCTILQMLPSPFCPVFHLCCMPLSCCLCMCVLLHDTTDASFSILSCVPPLLYASVLLFMYVCSVARYYRCFLLHSVLCSTFVVCLCLTVYVCVFCCTILQMLPSPFCPVFHLCCMPLSYCLCMCVLLHDTTDASFSILSCVPPLLYASVLLFMYVCSVARYYRCFLLHSVLCSTFVVCLCLAVYVCVFCCTILQMLPSPFCPVFHVCCMPLSYCLCMCVLLHDTTDASFSILSCVPRLLYASVLLFMYVCSVARYYRCFLLHSVLCSTFVVCLCLAVYVCVFCCTILQMLPSPFCPVFHVCCMPLSCCLCMCVLLHDTTDASFSILSCVPRLLYASVLLFMYVCSVARYYRCFLLHSVLCSTFVVCLCLAVYVCVFCCTILQMLPSPFCPVFHLCCMPLSCCLCMCVLLHDTTDASFSILSCVPRLLYASVLLFMYVCSVARYYRCFLLHSVLCSTFVVCLCLAVYVCVFCCTILQMLPSPFCPVFHVCCMPLSCCLCMCVLLHDTTDASFSILSCVPRLLYASVLLFMYVCSVARYYRCFLLHSVLCSTFVVCLCLTVYVCVFCCTILQMLPSPFCPVFHLCCMPLSCCLCMCVLLHDTTDASFSILSCVPRLLYASVLLFMYVCSVARYYRCFLLHSVLCSTFVVCLCLAVYVCVFCCTILQMLPSPFCPVFHVCCMPLSYCLCMCVLLHDTTDASFSILSCVPPLLYASVLLFMYVCSVARYYRCFLLHSVLCSTFVVCLCLTVYVCVFCCTILQMLPSPFCPVFHLCCMPLSYCLCMCVLLHDTTDASFSILSCVPPLLYASVLLFMYVCSVARYYRCFLLHSVLCSTFVVCLCLTVFVCVFCCTILQMLPSPFCPVFHLCCMPLSYCLCMCVLLHDTTDASFSILSCVPPLLYASVLLFMYVCSVARYYRCFLLHSVLCSTFVVCLCLTVYVCVFCCTILQMLPSPFCPVFHLCCMPLSYCLCMCVLLHDTTDASFSILSCVPRLLYASVLLFMYVCSVARYYRCFLLHSVLCSTFVVCLCLTVYVCVFCCTILQMLPSPFCPVFHLCCMPLSYCLCMCVLLHDTTDASFSILSCVPHLLYASVLLFMYVCSVARYYRCFLLHSVLCSTFVVCLCLTVYVCVFCCTILQMLPSPFCPVFHVCCMPLSYCLCMCVLLHDTTDASFSILSCVPRLLYASVLLFMYVCSVARYYRCFLLHSVLCSTFVVCLCLTVYVCVFCCTILQMLPSPFCPVFHVCCMPLSCCLCMCVLLHDTTDASFSILSCVPPLLYASVLLFMYVCSVAQYYRCFLLHSVLCSTFVVCLCLTVYVCVFCCTILQMLPSPFCPVFHLCCMPLSYCLCMCVLLHDTTDASFSILSCVPRLLYASVLLFMYVCSVARYYRCFLLHSVLCSTFVVCLCLAVYVCVFCCTILQMLPSPFCPVFHVCCMPLSYCLCMCVLLHDTTDASFSILSCVPPLLYASVLLFMYVCSVARYYRCFLLHSVLCSTFVVCLCLTVYVCVFCCTILQMLPSPFCPVFHLCCMPLSYCLCMCVLLHDTTDASFSILSCVPRLLYASVLLFMYVCSVARYYRCFLLHSVLCSTFVVCLCLTVYVCVFCCTILQMLPSPFCPVFHVCCMPLSCCLCMCVLLHDTTDASFFILSCVPRLGRFLNYLHLLTHFWFMLVCLFCFQLFAWFCL